MFEMMIILKRVSKSERLIYIVMGMWVVFGLLGIHFSTDLIQLAGYYTTLTVFIGSYFWGEHKRTSQSTPLFVKGPTSSRELIIYVTIFLWLLLGIYGMYKKLNLSTFIVYFSSLTPFVTSYIIYKTTKGFDLLSNDEGDFTTTTSTTLK